MDLEGIILSEVSQERQVLYDLTMCNLEKTENDKKKTKLIETADWWLPEVGGEG